MPTTTRKKDGISGSIIALVIALPIAVLLCCCCLFLVAGFYWNRRRNKYLSEDEVMDSRWFRYKLPLNFSNLDQYKF